jgi:tetratricopeptide (TPR) repeat protein
MECSKCNASVSIHARYCDQCGANLKDDADFLHRKALDRFHRGMIEEALADWDVILKRDPANSTAWYYRGLALYDQGRLEEAVASFEKALSGAENPFRVHFKLGMAQYGLGDLPASVPEKSTPEALKHTIDWGSPI